jgi:hypothetical protein
MLKQNLKYMLGSRDFFIAFTFGLLLVLGSLALALVSFQGNLDINLYPAWYYFGVDGTGLGTPLNTGSMRTATTSIYIFLQLFLPFLASMAFVGYHFDTLSSGALKGLLPRVGRGRYYRSGAFTAFLGGFLVIFTPMLLEQLVLCVAFPMEIPYTIGRPGYEDNHILGVGEAMQWLQVRFPYLFNFIYCLLPGLTGGVAALLSYACSLYFHKNRFLTLTQAAVVWAVMIPLLLNPSVLELRQTICSFFVPAPGWNFVWWLGCFLVFLIVCATAVELKIRVAKDEVE